MLFFLRFSLFAVVVALAAPASAATFVVDSVDMGSDGDLADDTCEDVGGACTLQAAIEQANSTPGPDRIEFAIAGAGPHVIRPDPSGLAAITGDLVIDGYTQPGASRNSFPNEMNAQIAIEIESLIGIGEGLRALGGRVVLQGLSVRGFETCVLFDPVAASLANSALVGSRVEACGEGVVVGGDTVRIGGVANADRNLISNNGTGIALTNGSNFVVNNLIGTDASGTVALGNGNGIWVRGGSSHAITDNLISGNSIGVDITPASNGNTLVRNLIGVSADGSAVLENVGGINVASSGNQIGLPSPGRMNANVISGNIVGVALAGPANRVEGNYFGTGPGGVGSLGNYSDAIVVYSSGNVIGAEANDVVQDQGNVIAFSTNNGITIPSPIVDPDPPLNNSLRGNLFYGNAYIDIDLGGRGPDGIDPGDADSGANNRQNSPELDVVTTASGQTVIAGKLDTAPGSYRLDFYSSPACDTGIDTGAGKFYLGSDVVTVMDVPADFSSILLVTAQGNAFSAMATDANGNSSELARCFATASAGGANLSVDIAIDGGVTQVAPGSAVRFVVSVSNAGPDTASNVPVVIARPAGFDSWSSSGVGTYGAATGLWSAGTLAPGASASRVFDATIGASATGVLTVLAEAEQGLSQPDPDLAGNRSTLFFTVLSGAHLVVTQSVAASAQPGDSLSLELSVRNDGPEDAIGVTLVGRLDEGLELDVASAPPGTSFNAETGDWSLEIGDLGEGDTALLTLPVVHISPAAPLGVGLKHTVNATATTPRDPMPTLSTAVVGVGAAADLAVTDFAKWSIVGRENHEFFYLESVTVENGGPDDVSAFAVDFQCNDRLPFLTLPTSCTSPNSPATCPLRCVFGGLRAGESIKIKLTGKPSDVTATVTSDSAAPYFDANPSNNSLQAIVHPTNRTCGLLGIESPILFGLLLLLRGRRGRDAFRRVFPGSVLALAVVLGGSVPAAHAAPVMLTVDSSASGATISVMSSLGSPPAAPVSLSGSATADIALANHALFGLTADSLQLTGAALEFSDAEILLSSPPLYQLSFASNGIGASGSGPSSSGFGVAPGLSLFDVVGSALAFDTGTIPATGTYFGVAVSESLDLAASPFTSYFPINSVAQVQVLEVGGGSASVRLALPFSAPLRLWVDGELVTVTIAGTVVLNGVTVPEPASVLLLAPVLLGLGALRRRRSRQRSAIT